MLKKGQVFTPVYAWAGDDETMAVPYLPDMGVQTFEEFLGSLPEMESHHVVIYDSKAG